MIGRARIVIPENKSDLCTLAVAIKTQHLAMGPASPLKDMDWAQLGPAIDEASGFDKTATPLSKDAEKATGSRHERIPKVGQAVHSARDILSGLKATNRKALGDWTFVGDDSPQKKSPPPPQPEKSVRGVSRPSRVQEDSARLFFKRYAYRRDYAGFAWCISAANQSR